MYKNLKITISIIVFCCFLSTIYLFNQSKNQNINDTTSLTTKTDSLISLPPNIYKSNSPKKIFSAPKKSNFWNINLLQKKYDITRKGELLTVTNNKNEVILKNIKYISQINNTTVQLLDHNTDIKYYDFEKKQFTTSQETKIILDHLSCGAVTSYGYKIEKNKDHYFLKEALSFASYDFQEYITIDSITNTNVKDIYFLNKKRSLEFDDNSHQSTSVIIDYTNYFGVWDHQYGIEYFDSIDIKKHPIKIKRNGYYGYYHLTPTSYIELNPFEFGLSKFKDQNNKIGYISLNGTVYYK